MAAVKNPVLHVLYKTLNPALYVLYSYMDPLFGTEHCRGAKLAMGQARRTNCEAAGSDPNMSHSLNSLEGPGFIRDYIGE